MPSDLLVRYRPEVDPSPTACDRKCPSPSLSSVQTSATGTVAVGLPEPGQLVHVRSRRWLVENVERRTPSESPLVRLACADDHDQSQILDVFWEYEIDRKILCRGRRGEMIATAQGSTFIHQHIRILRWPRTIRWHCKTYGLRSRIASDAAPARRTRQPFQHEDLRSCAEVRDPLLEQRSGRQARQSPGAPRPKSTQDIYLGRCRTTELPHRDSFASAQDSNDVSLSTRARQSSTLIGCNGAGQ